MKSKMALIGKNISHSRSKEVYENLIEESVDYTLLDFEHENDIPDLKKMLNEYPKISITAPYKNVIFQRIDKFEDNDLNLESVNAIKLKNDNVIGINTDILAFKKLFHFHFPDLPNEIVILGSGNMAKMLEKFFRSIDINTRMFSRSNKLIEQFSQHYKNEKLIINCCSREYLFEHKIAVNSLFWDMNYNQKQQEELILKQNAKYLDGYSLLVEQARFALSFWN